MGYSLKKVITVVEYIREVFNETLELYTKITSPPPLGLRIIPKERHHKTIKSSPFTQELVQTGLITNLTEAPTYGVVYKLDTHIINIPLTGKLWIGICLENALYTLNKLNNKQQRLHLIHVFAHEISHIVEHDIVKKFPYIQEKAIEASSRYEYGRVKELMYHESIADQTSYLLVPEGVVKEINLLLYDDILTKYVNKEKEGAYGMGIISNNRIT